MRKRILKTLENFGWRQWLVAVAFVAVLGFTGLFTFRTVRDAIYWKTHTDEPIQGWMNVGYVAHSYHVPPYVLYSALGLPNRPPDRRPLIRIAEAQGRSMDEIKSTLEDAIVHARPPYPQPTPPPRDQSPTP